MVRTSLQDIIGRLPRVLQNRYAGANSKFWLDRYNDLLGRLERMAAGPNGTIQIPLPWDVAQGSITIPPQIIDVTQAFLVDETYGKKKLAISPRPGGFIVDESTPSQSTIVGDSSLSRYGISSIAGRDFVSCDAMADAKIGDAATVSASKLTPMAYLPGGPVMIAWQIDSIIELPRTVGVGTDKISPFPMESGEYDWYYPAFPQNSHIWVFRNYLLVEGHRAFRRASGVSDISSLAPAWDSLVESWLRFVGELQTDQSSTDSVLWEKFWSANGSEWMRFHAQAVSSFKQRGLRPGYTLNQVR